MRDLQTTLTVISSIFRLMLICPAPALTGLFISLKILNNFGVNLMSNDHEHTGCGCCGLSRRSFLATGCVACAGVTGAVGSTLPFVNTARADDGNGNMKVRVIFVLRGGRIVPNGDWPYAGYDWGPDIERTINVLNSRCEGIDFIASETQGSDHTRIIIEEDAAAGNIDGYVVMQMNNFPGDIFPVAHASGKPVLYGCFLLGGSGTFLILSAAHLRAKTPNFAFITSSDLRDLAAAAQCLLLAKDGKNLDAFTDAVTKLRIQRTPEVKTEIKEDKLDLLTTEELLKELKGKKIIEVEGHWPVDEPLKEDLGIEIIPVPFAELNDLWENADKVKAQEILTEWKDNADEVIGIPGDVIEASARMYLAQKALLDKYGACAITINCLGGFYGGHIHAYPCLGFHQLLNEGLIGACECDTRSTIAMVVMTTLTKGRPGFISDPIMDIATRQVIYAHCVASNKAFGPEGVINPYKIMTHTEDLQGASVRSFMPLGYMTTTVEFDPPSKRILFHQGVSVSNNSDDRACRTKLAVVPVGDFEKLFTQWDQWGWHRVTYYGDLREAVFSLAEAIGWTVLEEA